MSPRNHHRTLGAVIAVLVVLQAAVVVSRSPGPKQVPRVSSPPVVSDVLLQPFPGHTPSPDPAPAADPSPLVVAAPPAGEAAAARGELQAITPDEQSASDPAPPPRPPARDAQPEAPPQDPARARFEQRFPGNAAAQQDTRDPATTRWAVLIGINEHQGGTRDNVGSRQDAEELWQHLVDLGWRQDQVLLLTDADATYENITQAIAWLARKTDEHSVAVFHYSGHTKKWYGQDADGDGEVTDEGLWPHDNRHLIDSEWVARMAAVGAGRLWIDIGGCESAGLADPGLSRPGRILTFSSTESEKSYEDPGRANSVWGYYLADEALLRGLGDLNGDGTVTVEEAYNYAGPRAAQRTDGQQYGAQHAVVDDRVEGDFDLRIPAPPPPPRPEPEPTEDEDEDDDPPCTLLFCLGSAHRS